MVPRIEAKGQIKKKKSQNVWGAGEEKLMADLMMRGEERVKNDLYSNFETSATISERMQDEDHRFLGRVWAGGVANFSFV